MLPPGVENPLVIKDQWVPAQPSPLRDVSGLGAGFDAAHPYALIPVYYIVLLLTFPGTTIECACDAYCAHWAANLTHLVVLYVAVQ